MNDSSQSDEVRCLIEELRASEARFRAMCECAPLGIYVSEIGRGVVYVNPAMQQIMGRTQEELLGLSWQQYLHPDDREHALRERERNYQAAAPIHVSSRYVRGDGKTIWTQLHAAPMREGDTLLGYVGTLEDVSEHRALQAQLIMAGRLASVGTLAAGVAHEVNTPLAVALSNLEWTQARLSALIEHCEQPAEGAQDVTALAPIGPTLTQRLRALIGPLHDAGDAAQRVSLIMKDLTLFSRPDAGEQSTADLGRVLDSAARMGWHEMRHRARLVRDYTELPWVHGSEARLGQVFLNLLINAAQAIPAGRVDDHEVRVCARLFEPGVVTVEVRDTGVGIAPDVLERIFDPFFTTKPQNVGTGLGLAICHRIVSGLGGRVEVESEPARGTVFRVLLRTADAVARSDKTPAQPLPSAPRRGRVLVIDDDESMLGSMALMLGDDNDVETLTNARTALERLQKGERYDAVLCDLMMPDMNGMQFHARLAASLPELADQVIFLTGGAFTISARDFLERVPNARLDKPFAVRELAALVAGRVAAQHR